MFIYKKEKVTRKKNPKNKTYKNQIFFYLIYIYIKRKRKSEK